MQQANPSGQRAWQTLMKGVRAVNLYSAGHTQVRRTADSLRERLDEALQQVERLRYSIRPDGVDLDGVQIFASADERETLIERLFADGVRALEFHGVPDAKALAGLFGQLAPYCHAERAPLRSVADALRWEPVSGLSVLALGQQEGGSHPEDAVAAREQRWRREVVGDPDALTEPLDPEALRARWDGTGGTVPWPPPMRDHEARALVDEVEAANASGAPLSRVGRLLAQAVARWAREARALDLLRPLPGRIEERLERERPGDVARLLEPLIRWAEEPSADPDERAVREHVAQLVPALLSDRNLSRLLESARAGRIEPLELASYFSALPARALPELVIFLAELPDGPWREAVVQVGARLAGDEAALLRDTVAEGAVGPALAALDVVDQPPATRVTVGLALLALRRTEGRLRLRGLQMLLPHPSRTVAEAVLPLVADSQREVRSLALSWMARYEHRAAFEPLVDLTRGARFPQLPLAERLEIGRTLGVVGGRDALALVRDNLGDRWHRADPSRSAPWLVCLAATGLEEAGDYLQRLNDSAPAHLLEIAQDALALWRRRRADLLDGPAPPALTAPGSPIPSRHGPPTTPTPGPHRLLSRPAWKGPAAAPHRGEHPPDAGSMPGGAPPWQEDE